MSTSLARRFGFALLVLAALVVVLRPDSAGAVETRYIDIDLTGDEQGVWLTRSDGSVETRGLAPHFGDRPGLGLDEEVVALASTPTGDGYWLFTNKANVFAYGTAVHHGDFGHLTLAGDIVAAVATTDGEGYYLIGADGGIFNAGSALFYGSVPGVLPGVVLDAPVVAVSATPGGYVLVAADGGTFAFGSAAFHGSIPEILPGVQLASGIVGLVPGSAGYLMLGGDGGIFNFGVSRFHGSLSGVAGDVVAVAVKSDLSGYLMLDGAGTVWPLGDTRHIGVARTTGLGNGSVAFGSAGARLAFIDSEGPVTVVARDGANNLIGTVIGSSTAMSGYVRVHFPTAVRFDVVSATAWTFEIAPISYALHWRGATATAGVGREVLRLAPPSAGSSLLTTAVDGGATVVIAHDIPALDSRLLLAAEAPVDRQSAIVPTWGPVIVEIQRDGEWTLEIAPPSLPRTVDLTGDSVAITMEINLPSSLNGTFTVRDSAIEGCGIIESGSMMSGGKVRRGFSACVNFAQRWADKVAPHNPDITVVVLGAWEVFDLWIDSAVVPFGSAQHDAILASGIGDGVDALLATGTEVALLEVTCQYPRDGGGLTALPERGDFARKDHLNELLRAEAAMHPHVFFITSPPEFCTDISIGDNRSLRWDGTHYAPAGGAFVWAHLRDQLLGLP